MADSSFISTETSHPPPPLTRMEDIARIKRWLEQTVDNVPFYATFEELAAAQGPHITRYIGRRPCLDEQEFQSSMRITLAKNNAAGWSWVHDGIWFTEEDQCYHGADAHCALEHACVAE